MEVRAAEPADRERMRAITRDSLQSSYSLSPQQIETILTEEFDDTSLSDLLTDPAMRVLVVDEPIDGTETASGFIIVEVGSTVTIQWLHVDPEARGGGIATVLLESVRDTFTERPIAAYILDDAAEGGQFLEGFGLEQHGHDHIEIGGEEFAVTVFTERNTT